MSILTDMERKNRIERRHGGAGRNQGRRAEDGVQVQRLNVTLDSASLERTRLLGDGNVSLGLRKAIAGQTKIEGISSSEPTDHETSTAPAASPAKR